MPPHELREIFDRLERIERECKTTNTILTGDGIPENGVIVKLDRLQQSESKRVWFFRSVIGALLLAIAAWGWAMATSQRSSAPVQHMEQKQ
jgi:hypothetical protein